jgi:hypothetical protein
MGKITWQVFQDEQDIKNGMIQLAVQEDNRSAYQYFTLQEWAAFKKHVNDWEPNLPYDEHRYDDTPMRQLDYDGNPYNSLFLGNSSFNIELCFSTITIWRKFKKLINKYTVECVQKDGVTE